MKASKMLHDIYIYIYGERERERERERDLKNGYLWSWTVKVIDACTGPMSPSTNLRTKATQNMRESSATN